jgi:subtilisin family serine protease
LDVGVNTVRTVPPPSFTGQTGAGVLVGVVDTGVEYTNPDFQNPDGTTRLVSIWDQTGAGTPPAGFSYGVEWLPADINALIPSEVDSQGHGSHVLGIAGGNGSNTGNGQPAYTYVGMAPQADLCMVKTTFQTNSIVDGVNYIFQKAASLGKQAVVNLSLGTQEGPHDGTLDMDVMLNALTGPGKIIVASAGNSGSDNLHGQLTLSGSTPQNMTLTVPAYTPAAGTGNDVLLFSGWYAGSSQISVKIVTPTGVTVGPVLTGTNLIGVNTADGWLNIHNGTSTPSNGAHEIYIELYDANSANPPKTGTWTFTFTPVSIPGGGRVDMYLYENALANGAAALAKWNQGLAFGGVVGSPGDADSIITAAAHVTKDCWDSIDGLSYCWNPRPTLNAIASFSSQGPRRDGVQKPDLSAPGFGVTSTLSADYIASTPLIATDGVHVNFAGTSMSAPHITGATALLLARSEWATSTPSKIKARLRSTARTDAFTGSVPNATWGYGKLDIGAALAIPLTLAVPRPPKGTLYVTGRQDSVNVALTGFTADTIDISLSLDGGATYPISLGSLFDVPSIGQPGLKFYIDVSYMTTQAKVRAVARKGATVLTSFSDSLFAIGVPTAVQESPGVPARFALHPNTPNPFNPSTEIHFELDRAGPATLRIYSVNGALVRTLVDHPLPAGHYHARWDGTDSGGRPVGSGIYVYRLSENGRNLSRKMSLLK